MEALRKTNKISHKVAAFIVGAMTLAIMSFTTSKGYAQTLYRLCYVDAVTATTAGHRTKAGARVAAKAAWKQKAGAFTNRTPSHRLSIAYMGDPKAWKDGKRWRAKHTAYVCYRAGSVLCRSGNTTPCGCHKSWRAAKIAKCQTWLQD